MRKIIILFFVILLSANLNSQSLYPIKETYDQILEPHYTLAGSLYDYNNTNSSWWHTWGWNLLSYLRMYEITKDKAYLNKFIKHSYNIQMKRGSENIWNTSMNDDEKAISLYTGQLIHPMAEFVYIVKTDATLYNTNLLPGLIPGVIGSYTMLGYGDYANWLQGRVTESLDYMNQNYWMNSSKCYSAEKLSPCERVLADNDCVPPGICFTSNCPESSEVNRNAPYASAMFYIGYVDPSNSSNYTTKAIDIVNYFKDRVTEYTPNSSFTWYHDGVGQTHREDVSHGSIDLEIPIIAYRLYGTGLYTANDMNKFAHTFTFNIWDRYNNLFHNNVFGLDGDLPDGNITSPTNAACGATPNGSTNFYGPGEILTWMPLYLFDDSNAEPNDIYTVLLTQAVKLLLDDQTAVLPSVYWSCHSSSSLLTGSQSVYGLSEVAKAQWDKECVNLTLYNRDVTYNQDFFVKNILTIEPESGNVNSFADPIISTPEFIVNPNITSNITAGEYISLKPGTRFLSGSNVSLKIIPSQCTNGQIVGDPETKSLMEDESSDVTASINESELKISPNPFTNTVSIHFNLPFAADVSILIYDNLGNVCYNEIKNRKMDAGNFTIPISTEKWANGIYHCVMLTNGNEIKTCKIIRTE